MKFHIAPLTGLFLAASVAAQAADPTSVYSKGGANPAAAPCFACHGVEGEGVAVAGFPRLAGLSAGYMQKQLEDFASGARANPIMRPIAEALSKEEIIAVSAELAAKPQEPYSLVYRSAAASGVGERLALRGAWERNIPECVSCHGPGGVGVGDSFPPLVGQSGQYLMSQLNAWRQGLRKNDPNDLMGHIARGMTDEEVKAVSTYFASLAVKGAAQ